jgi:hypothetical protein
MTNGAGSEGDLQHLPLERLRTTEALKQRDDRTYEEIDVGETTISSAEGDGAACSPSASASPGNAR